MKKLSLFAGLAGIALFANSVVASPPTLNYPLTIKEKQQLQSQMYIIRQGKCSEKLEDEIENLDNRTFVVPSYQITEDLSIPHNDNGDGQIVIYDIFPVDTIRKKISDESFKNIQKTIDSFFKSKNKEIILEVPNYNFLDMNGELFGKFLMNLYNNLDFECFTTFASPKYKEKEPWTLNENQIRLKKKGKLYLK